MKKAILLALLSSVMLASCATVDVRTEISPNGSAKREIDAYVDNTTYRYDKNTVDSYTKELAERGSGSVSVTQDNGGLKITTKLSADSIQALNAKTTKLFTQSGSSCGFSVNGSFDSFGILQKDITVKEAITTKCLEYITWVSTYVYDGTEIGRMQYPNQKSVELQYETKEDPLLMTLVYLLSAVFVTLVIMVAYFMEVAVVKEIVDFFAPTFKKLYYKLILILFSPPEKNGNRK